jgi:hypothetical protein
MKTHALAAAAASVSLCALGTGCANGDSPATDSPKVQYDVDITANTPMGLPTCDKTDVGAVALVTSPVSLWTWSVTTLVLR